MCTNSVCNTKRSHVGASTSHQCGTNVWTATPHRYYPDVPNEWGGRGKFLEGDLYGVGFSSERECWAAMQERGYTRQFNRNLCSFTMSKRARSAGKFSRDHFFVRGVLRSNPKVVLPEGCSVRGGQLYRGREWISGERLSSNGKEVRISR